MSKLCFCIKKPILGHFRSISFGIEYSKWNFIKLDHFADFFDLIYIRLQSDSADLSQFLDYPMKGHVQFVQGQNEVASLLRKYSSVQSWNSWFSVTRLFQKHPFKLKSTRKNLIKIWIFH